MAAPPQPLQEQQPEQAACEGEMAKTSLYVGDLDPEVTEMELAQAFCEMGPIASVRLCRDSFSRKSLCYAYINFFSPSDASKALACLNHTDLKGKPMRIMWSQRDPHPRKTGVANLFVKNLDPSVNGGRLQGIFCKFGTIVSCKVAEQNGKSKGFGFVQFESEESAMDALKALNDTVLDGKKLYVSKFVKKNERKEAHEEPIFTNLYVKNLGEDLTKDLLQDKFSEFGKVCNAVIMKNAEGKSRGFGFVNFESAEEAKKAVEALNGAILGSKKLFVGRAQKKAEREELLKHEYKEIASSNFEKLKASNLYVKNLDVSIDDNKLQEHFGACGRVTSAKVMRYDNGISKGFGFVCFSTPEEAKKALRTLNGTIFQGKYLYVAMAQRKEERHKALQSYYAQYPVRPLYPSNWDVLSLRFRPPYYKFPPCLNQNPVTHINQHQPLIYPHFGRNVGVLYPFATHNYQRNVSTYLPMKQTWQGNTRDWVYQQHSMTYGTSNVPVQDLKNGNHGVEKHCSWKMGNQRSGLAETSCKGSEATKGLIATMSPGSCKKNIGERLHPLVHNLQPDRAAKITGMLLEMNNSDIAKLLESPNSLAVQVDKAVQVLKEANAWNNADSGISVAKSARCLSY